MQNTVQLLTSTITMQNSIIQGCSAQEGGGVYVNGGSIKGCTATGGSFPRGGGVYIAQKGKFEATNVTIGGTTVADGNKAGLGGGIYMASGTNTTPNSKLYLMNCTVAHNTAESNSDVSGAGICIEKYNNNCTIINGEIKKNTIKPTASGKEARGAGLFIGYGSLVTVNGCKIFDNNVDTANNPTVKGKGVYIAKNTGGLEQNARLIMKGSARVGTFDTNGALTDGNDVYLSVLHTAPGQPAKSTMIKCDDTLSANPAAQITPESYAVGRQVLEGDNIAQNCTRFKVTPQGGQNWKIDTTGKLQKQQ